MSISDAAENVQHPKINIDHDDDRRRLVWPTQAGGFLVSVGFMSGIANLAFFPSAVCTEGQTGNFIVVYMICVFIIGYPITYLHLCLGQYSGLNAIELFGKLCPMLRGIGWSWLLIMIPLLILSNMNTTWSLYYLYVSTNVLMHGHRLPWSPPISTSISSSPVFANSIRSAMFYEKSSDMISNSTNLPMFAIDSTILKSATTPRYYHHLYQTLAPVVLLQIDEPSGMLVVVEKRTSIGRIEMRMVTASAVAWIIVFLCVFNNGVHTMNKVVYISATLPFLLMAILLMRAISLRGAFDGLALLVPHFSRIGEKSIWVSALKLVFFDLQIGVGVLISIAKHNRFYTNVYRDAISLMIIDVFTSVFAASIAFCFLGYLADTLDESDVRAMCRGQIAPHLLWDQILRAIARLPQSTEAALFAMLYQLMLVIGAIDCTFTWCECFASSIEHRIPLLDGRARTLRAAVCILFFLLSLPCCYQGGVHIYNLFVHYAMHWNVMIIAVVQFAAISIAYGVENLCVDICKMLRLPTGGNRRSMMMRIFGPTGIFIRHTWNWLCPMIITILLVCDILVKSDESEMNRHLSSSLLWHLLALVPLVPIPAFAFWEYCHKHPGRNSFMPTEWKSMRTPIDDYDGTSVVMTGRDLVDDIDSIYSATLQTQLSTSIRSLTTTTSHLFRLSSSIGDHHLPYFELQQLTETATRSDHQPASIITTKHHHRRDITGQPPPFVRSGSPISSRSLLNAGVRPLMSDQEDDDASSHTTSSIED